MSRWVIPLLLVALLTGPGFGQGPRAQDATPPPLPIPRDGTEIFRWLFRNAKITPVTEREYPALFGRLTGTQPAESLKDVIVVLLGDNNRVRHFQPYNLAQIATSRGGAALIAADTPVNLSQLFGFTNNPGMGVRVVDATVLSHNANDFYRGRADCPYVVPLPPPRRATGPEWNLFTDLDHIATNTSGFIQLGSSPGPLEIQSTLAGFPAGSTTKQPGGDKPLDRKQVFAVGGSGFPERSASGFRCLALADPSVFINVMMVPDDPQFPTDNLQFANRVVNFLAEEEVPTPRRRTRCLFIQNGEIVTTFDDLERYLNPPLPLPSISQEKIVDWIDQAIDKSEENDSLTKRVLGNTPETQTDRLRKLFWVLVGIGAALAVFYVVNRVWGACQPLNIPPPPPAGRPSVAATGPSSVEGVFDRRERELLRRNNLYEPVRAVLQEMFSAAGAPASPGRRLPAVEIADTVRRPGTLQRALVDLWDVAHGPPAGVTVQRWKVLESLFVRVQQAHADGKWWFRHAGPKSGPGIGQRNGA